MFPHLPEVSMTPPADGSLRPPEAHRSTAYFYLYYLYYYYLILLLPPGPQVCLLLHLLVLLQINLHAALNNVGDLLR